MARSGPLPRFTSWLPAALELLLAAPFPVLLGRPLAFSSQSGGIKNHHTLKSVVVVPNTAKCFWTNIGGNHFPMGADHRLTEE